MRPKTFNLIYHVTPMGSYRWNLELLRERLHIFNGKKIAAVAQGPGLDDIRTVQSLLPGVECAPFDNSPEYRETATLKPLLNAVFSTNREEATFYAHTKGVTRPNDEAVTKWTLALYQKNLDDMEHITDLLEKYPVVGAFKRYGVFSNFPLGSKWHYSGTFFWFRNRDLVHRPAWRMVPKHKYGAEAYLSLIFSPTEAGVSFCDNAKDLYNLRYVNRIIR